ncbi:MAG: isopentenyl-diphosphate Delta-isomerase [Woeseia sp.]|jgi:isopentenyl-diphosphate delta-isomerase
MTSNDKVVSSDSEELILVDADDNETGHLSKAECHDGRGVLHRAFSVFLFNSNGELLLQQRAGGKRLWPLFWSNSCCSHPRRGESMAEATVRRVEQELGIQATVEFVYKFSYQALYGELGAEHELCSVYLARSDDEVVPNRNEVAAERFVDVAALTAELVENNDVFTPWFKLEWRRLQDEFSEQLAAYTGAARHDAS